MSKEQYVKQIEQGADSAFTELGMTNPDAKYDENTYEWIVELINSVIDKNFSPKIIYSNDMPIDLYYQVAWKRTNKNISFSLVFYNKGKKIGETQILYGMITERGVEGIIKIYSCKKEIKKILQGEIK